MMPLSDLISSVRELILSHSRHDDTAFKRAADTIARELNVTNRPGEARLIREAVARVGSSGGRPLNVPSLAVLGQAEGLLTFQPPQKYERQLFFHPTTKNALDRVIEEHHGAASLAEAGLLPKSRLLFWGPPGCGKTAAAQWLGTQLDMPVAIVRLGSLITSYVGETGSNLQKVFTLAVQTPMVLLLDEADAIAKSRDDTNDVGELRRVVNALLQILDGFMSKRSVVILATNHSHLFDSAVWRRFDDVIEFPLPTLPERQALLRHLVSGLKLKGDLMTLAKKTEGVSYAEITRAVNEVTKAMVLAKQKTTTSLAIFAEVESWRKRLHEAKSVQRQNGKGREAKVIRRQNAKSR